VALGVWGQNSFLVHGFFTVAAIISGLIFQISLWEWLIVGLCVVIVWMAEMFNSALERLARAVNQKYDPNIRDALDIGSGAVLTAAIGAATVGGCLFLYHLLRVLGIL
jgi:diacylglycerol kinase (ATP)